MRAIILAAGQGTRLRPLTDHCPKAMVPVRGRPILQHALDSLRAAGVTDTCIVTGYKPDLLQGHSTTTRHNGRFESTNMVHSLFCARDLMGGDADVLVVYGDILFRPSLVEALARDPAPMAVAINTRWLQLWTERMDDPLADAETLRLDEQGNIVEIGRRPRSLADIQGQYTGLIRFSRAALPAVLDFHAALDRNALYDGKAFDQMYMTSFLQQLIDHHRPIRAVLVDGGWLEVDSPADLEHANASFERYLG